MKPCSSLSKPGLDLRERAQQERIDGKHLKKYRNDVFRLLQLLPLDAKIEVANPIQEDLRKFLDLINHDATLTPMSFGVDLDRNDGVEILRNAYNIS